MAQIEKCQKKRWHYFLILRRVFFAFSPRPSVQAILWEQVTVNSFVKMFGKAMKDIKVGEDEVEEFVWVWEVLKSVLDD